MSFLGGVLGGLTSILDSSLDSIFGNIGMLNQDKYNAKSQKRQFRYNQALQREQMMFDAYEAEKARQFASAQSAENYSRMLYLSNTAHQREVKDLRSAGLNPILSATGGSGASTFNVATPTVNQAHGSGASVSAMGVSSPMVKSHMTESVASFINALSNVQRVSIENKLADAQVANVNSATRLTNIKAAREDFDSLYDEALKRFQLEKEVIGIKQARTHLEQSIYTLNRMAVDNDLYNTPFGKALKAHEMMSTAGFSPGLQLSNALSKSMVGLMSDGEKQLYNYRPVGLPFDKNRGRSWQRRYHDNGWLKSVEVYPYKRK